MSAVNCRKLSYAVPSSSNRSDTWPPTAGNRLAALREKKPQRKAAQIRAFWPDIKVALENGHSYHVICECLEAAGILVTVKSLSSYVSRIRKIESAHKGEITLGRSTEEANPPTQAVQPTAAPREQERNRDPLANLRERGAGPTSFDYRPESADPNKLI